MQEKQIKRLKSHRKIGMQIIGTKERPRLSVFRSASHIYAKLIDDNTGKVLLSASDINPVRSKTPKASADASSHRTSNGVKIPKSTKINRAKEVGKLIAKEAIAKKIEKVVFDRGGFVFHGRIKAVADGAREGGLKF